MDSATRSRLHGIRILAAEDDEFCALVLRSVLESEGATVHVVTDGRQALDAVRERPDDYDVVVTDVQMPELDGLELARRLRELAPALPVVGQTAHTAPQEVERCLAAGMRATVEKPYDIGAFIATIARHARGVG